MTLTPVQRVLDALHDAGCAVRTIPDGWMAQCPAHNDRNPSLHVSEGDDNRAVLHCHAGCSVTAALGALKLTASDLFAESRSPGGSLPLAPLRPLSSVVTTKEVCHYDYHDADGEPVLRVVRYAQLDGLGVVVGKTFRQFHQDGAGGWTPGLGGVQPPLYRLPEVLAAIAANRPIAIVEGERDADRAYAVGLVATTAPMGAGKWREHHTVVLAGATVIVIADDDAPGRTHAQAVSTALQGVAASVTVMLPAEGAKDLSDHLDAGLPLSALRLASPEQLVADVANVAPPDELHARAAVVQARFVTAANVDKIPKPVMLVDGVLQINSLAWLQGQPGSAKTFVALDIAGCVGTGLPWGDARRVQPGTVLYLIAEGVSGLGGRIRAWEKLSGRAMDNVTFYPDALQLLDRVDVGALAIIAADMAPTLIVIDTQARSTVGGDENSARDMGHLVEALERVRAASGACVLTVHHEGRSGEHLRGSTALEGAATTVIKVDKDGPGVTLTCRKQKDAAEFEPVEFDLIPAGESASLRVVPPDGRQLKDTDVSASEAKLLGVLREQFGTDSASWSDLRRLSNIPESTLGIARTKLLRRGLIIRAGTELRPRYLLNPHPELHVSPP